MAWRAKILQLRGKTLSRERCGLEGRLADPSVGVSIRRDFKVVLAEVGVKPQQFRALMRSWRS